MALDRGEHGSKRNRIAGRLARALRFVAGQHSGFSRFELAEALDIDPQTAYRYLVAMQAAGLVDTVVPRQRGVETHWIWGPVLWEIADRE